MAPSRPLAFIAILAATMFLLPRAGNAGPPFITDDPVPVEYGHWEITAFSAGAHTPADSSGLGPSMEVNYGALPGVQLHILGGLGFNAQSGHNLQFGPSDTEIGAKIRLLDTSEDDWWPQVAVYPLAELPSGNAAHGLGAGYLQTYLPVWLQKDFGRWTIYGGGGYWNNPGPGNRDYWFSGVVLQRQITDDFALGAEVFHQTSPMVGRTSSFGFNLGMTYDINEHYHLLASAGQGGILYAINAQSTREPVTYYIGLLWSF